MRDQEVPFSTFVLSKATSPRGEESTFKVAKKKFVTQAVKSALPVWGKTSISLQQKSCSIASREASSRHRRESRSPGVSCRLRASGLKPVHIPPAGFHNAMADNVRRHGNPADGHQRGRKLFLAGDYYLVIWPKVALLILLENKRTKIGQAKKKVELNKELYDATSIPWCNKKSDGSQDAQLHIEGPQIS